MNALQKKIIAALAVNNGGKLAVGVSGGRDSMCLLHGLINCGAVEKRDILVVHVNHRLRETADRDELFVREYCEKNGIPFRAVRIDVERARADSGKTLEQTARELRYGIFRDIVKSGEASMVLTAHHALDNAESVLMHIFRGSGLDGLCGMTAPDVLRPLIDVYPAELDEYARENGIAYVTDETNLDAAPDRNFIRLNVIPLIESRYRAAVRAINNLSREAIDLREFIDGALDMRLINNSLGAVCVKDAALSCPLAARYVRAALGRFTLTDMTRDMIENVIGLKEKRTGATVELAHGVRAAREYGEVAIYIPRLDCDGTAELHDGANFIDGLTVNVELRLADPRSVRGGVVDRDKLDGAELRFWRDGDTFEPIGGVRKKLNRYFIDEKIPKRLRGRIPLVCRGSDVLVVCGMQTADGVKLTDSTRRAAVITVR